MMKPGDRYMKYLERYKQILLNIPIFGNIVVCKLLSVLEKNMYR